MIHKCIRHKKREKLRHVTCFGIADKLFDIQKSKNELL